MVVGPVGGRGQRGAAYLTLMISVAVISAILATTAEIVSHAQQRAREQHLLWVGDQIRRALVSYSRYPAGIDTYPKELEDLVSDRRRPLVQHHLRRLYFDPMTGSLDWGVVRNPQQRIIGVFSKSKQTPIKIAGFPTLYNEFEKAASYADWQFVIGAAAQPKVPTPAAPGGVGGGGQPPILQPVPGSSFAPRPAAP